MKNTLSTEIEIKAEATSAEILLFDKIGETTDFWTGEKKGISAKSFFNKLKEVEAKYNDITVRINTVGGSMVDGNAIYALLKGSSKNITIINAGSAFSMGAILMQAAKKGKRKAVRNGLMMIHEANMGMFGGYNATQMREMAEELDKFNATAIVELAAGTGKTEKEIKDTYFNGKDHFITAKEAKDLGLIDEILNEDAPNALSPSAAPHSHAACIQMVLDANTNEPSMIQKLYSGIKQMLQKDFSLTQKPEPMTLDKVSQILTGTAPITAEQRTEMLSVITSFTEAKFVQADIDNAVSAAKKPLTDEVASLKSDKANLEAKVAELEKKPGAKPTSVSKPKDDISANSNEPTKRVNTEAEIERDKVNAINSFSFQTSMLD